MQVSLATAKDNTAPAWGNWSDLQPIDLHIMCKFVKEFVNDSVYPDCATNQFHLCVLRILEDKMVLVEVRQAVTPNATS